MTRDEKIKRIIHESIKHVLEEDYNQFSEGDFASEDPYALLDQIYSDKYGVLDGSFSFNGYYCTVKDRNDYIIFNIEPKSDKKPFTVKGVNALMLKDKIVKELDNFDGNLRAAMHFVINRYLGQYIY